MTMTRRRVLVTGGAGFIGSNLVRRLVLEGYQVGVFDDLSRGRAERLPADVDLIQGDIRDEKAVLSAVRNYDVIWHLAYVQGTQTFYSRPKDVVDVGIGGMMNVLRACDRKNGTAKQLFLVSSSEAYQVPPHGMIPTSETVPLSVPDVTNPRYSYGGGKIACEVAAMAYGHADVFERLVIARPHNIIGPDMGFEHVIPEFAMRMAEAEFTSLIPKNHLPVDFPIQGSGLETRTFCDIQDCVDAMMILLESGEHMNVYHVGRDEEEVTISELAHRIAAWWGVEIRLLPGTLPQGSPPRRLPDISKLRALGYRPKVSLSAALPTILVWYRNVYVYGLSDVQG